MIFDLQEGVKEASLRPKSDGCSGNNPGASVYPLQYHHRQIVGLRPSREEERMLVSRLGSSSRQFLKLGCAD